MPQYLHQSLSSLCQMILDHQIRWWRHFPHFGRAVILKYSTHMLVSFPWTNYFSTMMLGYVFYLFPLGIHSVSFSVSNPIKFTTNFFEIPIFMTTYFLELIVTVYLAPPTPHLHNVHLPQIHWMLIQFPFNSYLIWWKVNISMLLFIVLLWRWRIWSGSFCMISSMIRTHDIGVAEDIKIGNPRVDKMILYNFFKRITQCD